jgi:hypothetical protein
MYEDREVYKTKYKVNEAMDIVHVCKLNINSQLTNRTLVVFGAWRARQS